MPAFICSKCHVKLENMKTEFHYMGVEFKHDLPRCPVCKQVHVPKDLAIGKMLKVEMELEEQ